MLYIFATFICEFKFFQRLGNLNKDIFEALFARIRYRTISARKAYGEECVHTGMEKIKWSTPKQVQKLGSTEKRSRNWSDRTSYSSILM